jgi:2-methylisocitrate lyase-like PEP mutase family enzyme
LLNLVQGGRTPEIDFATAQELGYRIAILPSLLIGEIADACIRVLRDAAANRRLPQKPDALTLKERFQQLGASEWDELRTRFRSYDASMPSTHPAK